MKPSSVELNYTYHSATSVIPTSVKQIMYHETIVDDEQYKIAQCLETCMQAPFHSHLCIEVPPPVMIPPPVMVSLSTAVMVSLSHNTLNTSCTVDQWSTARNYMVELCNTHKAQRAMVRKAGTLQALYVLSSHVDPVALLVTTGCWLQLWPKLTCKLTKNTNSFNQKVSSSLTNGTICYEIIYCMHIVQLA